MITTKLATRRKEFMSLPGNGIMVDVILNNFDHFHKLLSKLALEEHWVFRGQSSSNWQLASTFDRR